jgi:hypothetical protein
LHVSHVDVKIQRSLQKGVQAKSLLLALSVTGLMTVISCIGAMHLLFIVFLS